MKKEESEWTISNEFAIVTLKQVNTRNGIRLEIHSPKLGHTILLDPLELESLTWQDKSTFSGFLSTPFGSKK
ncbi:hypothetical protein [Brevibacillus sp. NRS-1366]|uniref:hypothetical protein n=1 Tax=Brevibacillus sp. NRS-1366 TaxID=3233899 RepID=UPI003D249BEF